MKKNTFWIVAGLLALLLIGVWSWRVQPNASVPAPTSDAPRVALPTAQTPTLDSELAVTTVPSDAVPVRVPIPDSSAVAAAAVKPAEFGLIRVLVLDIGTDRPLSGAIVTATHDSDTKSHAQIDAQGTRGKPFESIKTGPDGRVEIEMPPQVESWVSVSGREIGAGFGSVVVPALSVREVREIVLRIPSGNDLPFWLKLVEEETGAPIPAARVAVERTGGFHDKLVTDADGLVFHEGRSWMSTKLTIGAERRATLYLQPVPGHATADTALVVALPLAATLRIVVTGAAGAPVPEAEVKLSTPGSNLRWDRNAFLLGINVGDGNWTAQTDASGVAVLAQLPVRVPIRALLTAPKNWQPAEPFVFEPGETRTVTWSLATSCSLHGVLLDQEGRPVVRRSMWMFPAYNQGPALLSILMPEPTRSARTDDEGRFRFDDTGAGDWLVGPAALKGADRDDVAPLAQYVRVLEDQKEVDVTIRVDRGLFLRGRMITSDGKAPKGGILVASDLIRSLYATASPDREDGTFTIGPLTAGRYQLYGMCQPDARSDPIEVDAGSDGIEIRLKVGATLVGRIVGAKREAVGGLVTCARLESSPSAGMSAALRNGSFVIQGLDAGTFNLAVLAADGSVGLLEGITVQAGESRTGLTVSVAPGGSVRVQHEGPDRFATMAILQRGILITSDILERKTSRTFGAPPGSVTVRATYREDQRTVDRVVQVTAGETVEVTFEKGAR